MGDMIIIENLEVWPGEFPQKMTWEETIAATTNLGPGWRVPTIDEFKKILYPNRSKIPNIKTSRYIPVAYWSSIQYNPNNMLMFDFSDEHISAYNKTKAHHVLAVRDFSGNIALDYLLKNF